MSKIGWVDGSRRVIIKGAWVDLEDPYSREGVWIIRVVVKKNVGKSTSVVFKGGWEGP